MRHYGYIATLFLTCVGAFSLASVMAASPEESLKELQQQMDNNPKNLDAYFAYAQKAASLGMEDKAKKAYLHMLAIDPLLHRVKLDLGMLYLRTGHYDDAKHLFMEVLDAKPPKEVEANIRNILAGAKKAPKRSEFSASVSVGYNYDTNANSAAGSDHITFNNISIPLDSAFTKKGDGQTVLAASLQHKYRLTSAMQGNVIPYWNSKVTAYRADQNTLDDQDIQALIFQIGPSFDVKPLHTQFNLGGGYQYVELDGHPYLHVASGEISANYAYDEQLSFLSSFLFEERNFLNSPTVSTYTDRSGQAYQTKIGMNYRLGKKDILNASTYYRLETARQDYYANDQVGLDASYTHIFPHDVFTNLQLGYRMVQYEGVDALISTDTIRKEYEKSASLVFGKAFKHNLTATLGYQYRKVDSNLQNYEYDNHRVLAGVSWNYH